MSQAMRDLLLIYETAFVLEIAQGLTSIGPYSHLFQVRSKKMLLVV